MTPNQLKLLLSEIIKGYSKVTVDSNPAYFRHPNLLSTAEIDSEYDIYFNKAKNEGLKTLAEQEAFLLAEKLWTSEKETEIKNFRDYIENLKKSKTLVVKKAEKEEFDHLIKETEEKLNKILAEKSQLIGFTVETYANRRINEQMVFLGLFKESDLKERLFTQDYIDDLTDSQISTLLDDYLSSCNRFSEANLKKLALFPFFLNLFLLCDDNVQDFFGHPVIDLTFYQSSLFTHAKHFKALLSESREQVPDKLFENPDAFVEWFRSRKAAEKLLEDTNGAGPAGLVGATKEDLENLGIQVDTNNAINFAKKAKEKGGQLSMEDLLELEPED